MTNSSIGSSHAFSGEEETANIKSKNSKSAKTEKSPFTTSAANTVSKPAPVERDEGSEYESEEDGNDSDEKLKEYKKGKY